jgi:hypothetical protein
MHESTRSEFWKFVRERERIRLRRLTGQEPPWTDDPIMQKYTFTNVKRAHDRTSRLLMREFYAPMKLRHPSKKALLNATLYRYFGKIETARKVGWYDDWSYEIAKRLVDEIERFKIVEGRVFTSAYIVPSTGFSSKIEAVVNVASGVWRLANTIVSRSKWQDMVGDIKLVHNVGSFMAKEVILDYIMATGWEPDDWLTWTPVGPGGKRGALIVRDGMRFDTISEIEALEICRELFTQASLEWPDAFDVNGEKFAVEPLTLTDVQFQLCEYAKWWKAGNEGSRPKRRFRPKGPL